MQTVTDTDNVRNEDARREKDKKDKAAESLIQWHFYIDPDIQMIYRFFKADEEALNEPIKLIDVNPATLPAGEVVMFGFGPAGDIPYSSVTADVTPEEMERIRAGSIFLPPGWSLATAKCYTRPENHE